MPEPVVSDLYARKSTKDAGRSVARQERSWRSDCDSEGLTVGRTFVDPDFSASRYATRERPDYAALLEWIQGRNCQMISLWEVTRGSRQMTEWSGFLDLCRKMGVLIRIFGDGEDAHTYDPRRQYDREFLLNEGIKAESEIEKTRSRTRVGTADAAREGRPSGPMPDGYRREYGAPTDGSVSRGGNKRREIRQVVDEERAAIYRAAAEGILNGVPAHTIARILNAFEVPTPRNGYMWTGGGLYNRLLRPSMEGHRVLRGTVVTRNAWPAILDPETVAALRRMRAAPPASRSRSYTKARYLLSGVISCGLCGRPLSALMGVPRLGVKPRYTCDPNRRGCGRMSGSRDPIDELVSEMVVARLQEPDSLSVFEMTQVADAQLVAAQVEVDALAARRDELYAEAAKPGGPSMALVAAAERELLPKLEAASKRLRSLRTPPVLRGYDPADLAANWDSYPLAERKAVVVALAEVVLSPSKGGARVWKNERLAQSRWRGHQRTWGDAWAGQV